MTTRNEKVSPVMMVLWTILLLTMYVITFFLSRLQAWFHIEIFLLLFMLLYSLIFLQKIVILVECVVLILYSYAKLVLEIDVLLPVLWLWKVFVGGATLAVIISFLTPPKKEE